MKGGSEFGQYPVLYIIWFAGSGLIWSQCFLAQVRSSGVIDVYLEDHQSMMLLCQYLIRKNDTGSKLTFHRAHYHWFSSSDRLKRINGGMPGVDHLAQLEQVTVKDSKREQTNKEKSLIFKTKLWWIWSLWLMYFLSNGNWAAINVISDTCSFLGSRTHAKSKSTHNDVPLHIQLELTQEPQVGSHFRNERNEF